MGWSLLSLFRRAAGTEHPEDASRHLIDADGWLHGPRAIRLPAHPSWYGGRQALGKPIAIVWHYTHTKAGTAKPMAKRRQKKRDPKVDRAASWHFTVENDGTIWQMISAEDAAWHCAKGTLPTGAVPGTPVNRCTVGIELIGDGGAFSDKQVAAAEDLVRALVDAYEISITGCARNHSEFDPKRRRDAGPVWNGKHLPGILDGVFGPRG